MTLQLRPTFSESWYRVANLKVKLRASAQISRQYYRGERWYVVRDPAGNQFHRLSDPAYRFVALLDGSRTVAEAWDLAGGQLADDAPTQPEVIQILSHLYSANLVEADVTPDATVLLRRHKKLQERKLKGRLMNVLFPRIPLWDPDKFLVRWMPLVRLMFSKVGSLVWLAVVIAALAVVAPRSSDLAQAARNSIAPGNWLWLWAVFVFTKLIHELGHAFACRRFGGECHELGIMFLVFIPTPYVDASSAWGFPNKWQKIFVGAAGMIVELFFAALCAFVWANTNPNDLVNQLAFNAMLVASVSTVIFNANPLLRYDGYYMLSDWLEIPNLRHKSSEYALGLIKRHIFRVKAHQPLPPPVQRAWLLFYAVTSTVYRLFVGFMIILLVAFQIPVLGLLMALGGVITWMLVPLGKLFKYLTIEPELHRKRGRAVAFTLAVVAVVVVTIGIIRFPMNVDTVGIVEPVEGAKEVVRTAEPGKVVEVRVKDGQWVRGHVYKKDANGNVVVDGDGNPVIETPGDIILVCESVQLRRDIAQARAELRAYDAQIRKARATQDGAAEVGIAQEMKLAVQDTLDKLLEREEKLVLRAAIDGEVIGPKLDEVIDRDVTRGQEVCTIARADRLRVRAVLEQRDAGPVLEKGDPETKVRLAGDINSVLDAYDVRRTQSAQPKLPHASLTHAGGERLPVDPQDPTGEKPLVNQFEVSMTLDNPDAHYRPGQRAYVRFKLGRKPLIWQWGRRFWQLIQQESAQSAWS